MVMLGRSVHPTILGSWAHAVVSPRGGGDTLTFKPQTCCDGLGGVLVVAVVHLISSGFAREYIVSG